MPFIQQTPLEFTKSQVEAIKPNLTGVYGILKHDACIYVGKGDIRQKLLDHLNGDTPCILQQKPTHWMYEVTINADAREKHLILELTPLCN